MRSVLRKISLNNKDSSFYLVESERISGAERIRIGSGSRIGPGALISAEGGLDIGSNVIFGPNAVIWTRNHNFTNAKLLPYDEQIVDRPVSIGDGCWFGEGVKIAPGAKIGKGVIAAMGSVIFGEIPDFSVIHGNPAVVIRKRLDIKNFINLHPLKDSYLISKSIANK